MSAGRVRGGAVDGACPAPRRWLRTAAAGLLCGLLGACASAPRDQALALSTEGAAATAAFSRDIGDIASRLQAQAASSAFVLTWQTCQNPNADLCKPRLNGEGLSAARGRLVEAVQLRARAVEALGLAYAALSAEARYDAAGDMEAAVDRLIGSVNAYATALSAIPGIGAIGVVSQPVRLVAAKAAGLSAAGRQRRRLLAANAAIRAAVVQLRSALLAERDVFDSLAQQLIDDEGLAAATLVDAGVAPPSALSGPLLAELGLPSVKDPDSVLQKSRGAAMAAQAGYLAGAGGRVAGLRARYQTDLDGLSALVRGHDRLASERPAGHGAPAAPSTR